MTTSAMVIHPSHDRDHALPSWMRLTSPACRIQQLGNDHGESEEVKEARIEKAEQAKEQRLLETAAKQEARFQAGLLRKQRRQEEREFLSRLRQERNLGDPVGLTTHPKRKLLPPIPEGYLTIREAVDLAAAEGKPLCKNSINRAIKLGKIPGQHHGNRNIIPVPAFLAFLETEYRSKDEILKENMMKAHAARRKVIYAPRQAASAGFLTGGIR
jgi:hypothetical protein